MPRIEVEGFRLTVNTRDERGHKPHVAVGTPYDIRMSKRNVARARDLIAEHFEQLMGWWRKYHG